MRWCAAEAPPPRLAYLGAAEAYPALTASRWCRLYRLMEHRGLIEDAPALRMARYLADTDTVAADGTIADVPAMLRAYAARHQLSVQTGYADLRRLTSRGLVRQVQAAAPGHRARYRLCAPAAMIARYMPGLPPELARAIEPPPALTCTTQPVEVERDQPASPASCGQLDTSPLTREGSPPSPCSTHPNGLHRTRQHRCGGISDEETQHALSVLSACRREWTRQRGQHGAPTADQLARVVPLAALALRHVPPGEVHQLLTDQVAGARSLPGVLAWRLGRVVSAARRPAHHVRADETGERYAAMLASIAGNSAPDPDGQTPGAIELRRTRALLGLSRLAPRRHDWQQIAAEQAVGARAARAGGSQAPVGAV